MPNWSFIARVKPLWLSILFLISSPLWAQTGGSSSLGNILEIKGMLEIHRGDAFIKTKEPQPFYAGDEFRTESKDSALLRFDATQTLMKFSGDSRVQIARDSERHVFIKEGLVWGKKEKAGAPFVLETPVMVTAIRGTEFFVKVKGPDRAEVLVKEGEAEVQWGEETIRVGSMQKGVFEKDKGYRVRAVKASTVSDWAARFK